MLGLDLNLPTELEPDRQKAKDMLRRAAKANPNPEDWEIINALTGRYQDCKKSDTKKECQRAHNQAYYDGMERGGSSPLCFTNWNPLRPLTATTGRSYLLPLTRQMPI